LELNAVSFRADQARANVQKKPKTKEELKGVLYKAPKKVPILIFRYVAYHTAVDNVICE
jgi:hypothetical protein